MKYKLNQKYKLKYKFKLIIKITKFKIYIPNGISFPIFILFTS